MDRIGFVVDCACVSCQVGLPVRGMFKIYMVGPTSYELKPFKTSGNLTNTK